MSRITFGSTKKLEGSTFFFGNELGPFLE